MTIVETNATRAKWPAAMLIAVTAGCIGTIGDPQVEQDTQDATEVSYDDQGEGGGGVSPGLVLGQSPPQCGNGAVDDGESCDGDCPTECVDEDACTDDSLTGSADQCSARCTFTTISVCTSDDGCCPPGCDNNQDGDCPAECGNGVVEADERCDGDCPTECHDDDPYTDDVLIGEECRRACRYPLSTTWPPGEAVEVASYFGVTNGGRPTFYFSQLMSAYPSSFTIDVEGCARVLVSNDGVRFEGGGLVVKQSEVPGRGMGVIALPSCTSSRCYLTY